jgi:hypothetical protein
MTETMEIEVVPKSIQEEVNRTIQALLAGGKITVIENPAQMDNANKLLQEVKAKKKYVEELRDSQVRPLNERVKEVNAYFKQFVDTDKKNPQGQLDILEETLKMPMIEYTRKEEAKRIEAQRKVDEELRRKREAAEAEARKKREAEEAQRREAERKRQEAIMAERRREEAERRAAEAKTKAAREKAEKEAREAEAARQKAEQDAAKADGKADKAGADADAVLEVAATAVAPVIQNEAKVKGFSVAVKYVGVVKDEEAAKRYCLNNDKLHFLILDMKVINRMISAEKKNFKMDGIEVVEDLSGRSRS